MICENYKTLREIGDEMFRLRDLIEDKFQVDTLDALVGQCFRARRVPDRRFGNVMEQVGRIESAIKLAKRTHSTGDLYTAISRYDHALSMHKYFSDPSNSI